MSDAIADLLDKDDALSVLDHLALPSEGGDRVGVRFGFGIELYFSDPDRQRSRDGFLKILSSYQERFPGMLNRFLPDGAKRLKKVGDNGAELVARDMAKIGLEDGYGTLLLGEHPSSQANDDVSQYALGALIGRVDDKRNSFVEAYFPVKAMLRNEVKGYSKLLETVVEWCGHSRPNHGAGGITVQLKFDSQHQSSRLAFPLLKRFPGMNFPDAGTFALEARTETGRIKCVNWLTVLSDELVDALGGLDAMRSAVEPICRIHRYSGGVVIQAGEYPQIGDANRQEVPQAYRTVANFTRKLRFEGYKSGLFKVPKPLDAREETLAWVRRFD